MIYAKYQGDMWSDYMNLHIALFYSKIYGIGDLSDLLYYRNKLLNGNYDKQDYLHGYKTLNDEQKLAFESLKQERTRSRLIINSGVELIAKRNQERRKLEKGGK